MPRNRAHDSQVKQIDKMFSSRRIIEVNRPCSLHNRKGSVEIYKLGKRNSVDSTSGSASINERFNEGIERRAKSHDHTIGTGIRKQKLSNRNSIASTSDLFPNYTVIMEDSPSTDRRRSCFDGMDGPSDYPSMLRNFQNSLSLSRNKLNGGLLAEKGAGDSNNNNESKRSSLSPEKFIAATTETDNYLRRPSKRLSFDVNIDNLTTNNSTFNSNRKLSISSADSLECARSPSRRYSNHSIGSNLSPKHMYFDSADFEREVRC